MDYNKLAEKFLAQVKDQSKREVMDRMNSFSHGEFQVLFYLYRQAGMPIVPSDIARFTATSTARIATVLNNLEEKGMITREISRTDRRKILVALTEKGRKLAAEQRSTLVKHVAAALEGMGEERSQRFVEDVQLFFESGIKQLDEDENGGENA